MGGNSLVIPDSGTHQRDKYTSGSSQPKTAGSSRVGIESQNVFITFLKWGFPEVDLFAMAKNKKVARFFFFPKRGGRLARGGLPRISVEVQPKATPFHRYNFFPERYRLELRRLG